MEKTYGPMPTITDESRGMGMISRGFEKIFMVLTRFVRSCYVIGENFAKMNSWEGRGICGKRSE